VHEEGWPDGVPSRVGVLACLGLILLLATLLRVSFLDVSVYGDEAFHFAAADRAAAGQGITLAPNVPYRRGLWFTEAVIACRSWFGDTAWAQRLPAFVASLGCILLVYLIGARWFDPVVGLVAALVLALDRDSVFFGSYARFYSAAQCLSMGAVYAFDRGFSRIEEASARRPARAAAWAALSVLFLVAALKVQVLALSLVLGAGVFLLWRALFRWFGEGRRDWTRWAETWLLLAGVVGGALLALVVSPAALLGTVDHVPLWNVREGPKFLYYVSYLRMTYPFEILLAPVGAIFALHRWPRGAVMAIALFLPAFLVHSLLPQKVPRYIFLLLPYFLLLASCGYVFLWRRLRDLALTRRRLLWGGLSAAVVLGAIALSPSTVSGGPPPRGAGWVNWRFAVARVYPEIEPGDAIVAGVGDDLFAVQQYAGRADAHVCTPDWWRERIVEAPGARKNREGPYAIPCLSTLEQFRALAARHGRVWVFLRSDHLSRRDSKIAPQEMLQGLANEGQRKSVAGGDVTVLLLQGPSAAR
jgi:hypothetical protein